MANMQFIPVPAAVRATPATVTPKTANFWDALWADVEEVLWGQQSTFERVWADSQTEVAVRPAGGSNADVLAALLGVSIGANRK